MSDGMLLNDDAIVELTQKRRHPAQKRVLAALGIKYGERPDGSLAVLRAHVDAVLGAPSAGAKVKKRTEPNWEAMGAHASQAQR